MLMVAMEQNLEVMEKNSMGTITSLTSLESPSNGAGQ